MKRRSFTFGLASATATLAAGAARADFGDRIQIGASYPVHLYSETSDESMLISKVVAFNDARAYGIEWSGGAALWPENRADLSSVPAIGSLFRTPFHVRWQRARPLGSVFVANDGHTLAARVSDPSMLTGAQATLGGGDYSWDLPGGLGPIARLPVIGRELGAARVAEDRRLLIVIRGFVARY